MTTGTQLKSGLTLGLEDLLSPGVVKILALVDKLQGVLDRVHPGHGIDEAAAKVRGVTQAVDGLGASAGRAEGAMARLWGRVRAGAAGAMGALRNAGSGMEGLGAAMTGALGGIGLMHTAEHWAEMSNTLRHTAITAGMEGPAVEREMARLRTMFYRDALETGQSSRGIAEAYQELLQIGIPPEMLDRVIGAHSRAATAYNITPKDLGPAVGALLQNLRVPEAEIGGALAAMAVASREGRFKVTDFSRELPGVAAQMGAWGMHGRDAANVAFATLQTVMRNSAIPSVAATDYADALRYLANPPAEHAFARFRSPQYQHGIDLNSSLNVREAAGMNRFDAMMDLLKTLIKGKGLSDQRNILGSLMHNQQAGDAFLAMIQHEEEYKKLLDKLRHVTADTLETNFADAMRDPHIQLALFHEGISQVQDTLGEGFAPVLFRINGGLLRFNEWLQALNKSHPQLVTGVLGAVAALLALAAVLGVVGAVVAGVGALFAAWEAVAVVAAVGAIAAAATWLYQSWDGVSEWFARQWEAVKTTFWGFAGAIGTWASESGSKLWNDIQIAYGPVFEWFGPKWEAVKTTFLDWSGWVAGWAQKEVPVAVAAIIAAFGPLRGFFADLAGELQSWLAGMGQALEWLANTEVGRRLGMSGGKPTVAPLAGDYVPMYPGEPAPWGGVEPPAKPAAAPFSQPAPPQEMHITVRLDGPLTGGVTYASPGVSVRLDPGATTTRP